MENTVTYKICRFSDYSDKIDKFSYSVMIFKDEKTSLFYVLERLQPYTHFINHGKYKTLHNASKKLISLLNKPDFKRYYLYSYDCKENDILLRNISIDEYKNAYFL